MIPYDCFTIFLFHSFRSAGQTVTDMDIPNSRRLARKYGERYGPHTLECVRSLRHVRRRQQEGNGFLFSEYSWLGLNTALNTAQDRNCEALILSRITHRSLPFEFVPSMIDESSRVSALWQSPVYHQVVQWVDFADF